MEIIYRKDNDIKVKLQMMLDGEAVEPTSVPFDVRLWTNSKSTAVIAGWDGQSFYGGCSVIDDDYVQIVADANPKWWEGVIHGEAVLHYPDSEMADNAFDQVVDIVFNAYDAGEIVGNVEHVVYGLSAYDLAVQQGYTGTLTQWLASLKGQKGDDATIESQVYDASGNTVITWADGSTTTVKKGDKGDDGYTPVKGVDYFDGKDGEDGKDGGVIFPSFDLEKKDDGLHLVCNVPTTEADLDVGINENGHLILTI